MHITDNDILLYIEDKLPSDKRQELESHVGRCAECAGQFASLARIPSWLEQEVPLSLPTRILKKAEAIVTGTKTRRWWGHIIIRPPYRIAFAGLGMVAIAAGTYLYRSGEQSQFRSTDRVQPSLVMHPADGAFVNQQHQEFRWNSLGNGGVYRFSLLDDRGVQLWTRDLRDTSVVLPDDIVLMPGKIYLWRVESFLADKSLARSALHVFTFIQSP